jgi:hypothetical protein
MKTVGSQLATLFTEETQLRRQLAPFVKYLVLLVAVILIYGWLFHVIMAWEGQDHSWFTGVYWALTVMSTLGFGDITFETDLGRAFSSVVRPVARAAEPQPHPLDPVGAARPHGSRFDLRKRSHRARAHPPPAIGGRAGLCDRA